MLETGDAGRKDEIEAFMYYYLAAAQGMSGLPYDPLTNRFTSNEQQTRWNSWGAA